MIYISPRSHSAAPILEWEDVNPYNIEYDHPVLYDSPDPATRTRIEDIIEHPPLDDDGREICFYTPEGVRVPRRQPIAAGPRCGIMQDLNAVHALFCTPPGEIDSDMEVDDMLDDDLGYDINQADLDLNARHAARPPPPHDVEYTCYPHFFSKNIGQWQAHGVMRPMLVHIRALARALSRAGSGGLALYALNSQCYNTSAHSMRFSSRSHLAQKGVLTGAAAGPWATTQTTQTTASRLYHYADHSLPHETLARQLTMGGDHFLRLENNFLIDFTHLREEFHSGGALYRHFIMPVQTICQRRDMLDAIKGSSVVLSGDVRFCYVSIHKM